MTHHRPVAFIAVGFGALALHVSLLMSVARWLLPTMVGVLLVIGAAGLKAVWWHRRR